jgi:hypothetical protein
MKNIFQIALISVFLFSFSSCELERESYEEIYPEQFFRNEADVNKALTGLYFGPFRMGYGSFYGVDQYSYAVVSDAMAGTMGSRWADASGYPQYYEHRWSETMGNGYAKDFCERMYSQYNRLTSILETIKRIEAAPVSDALKAKAVAEAKVVYAWVGFILYDLFGPVPLITDDALAHPYEKVFIPRLSDQEYMAIMHAYLNDAIESGLPMRQDGDWGRVSKGLALMLKLKFYMVDKNFTEAEKIARELYAERGNNFDFYTGRYGEIFDDKHVRNKEIVHAIPCGLADGMQNRTMIQYWPVRYRDDRQCWFTFGMSWHFYDTFEPGDDRLNYIVPNYTSITGENAERGQGFLTNAAAIIKVDDSSYDSRKSGEYASVDYIVYRFSDVMLSLAECINENTGAPTSEAIGLVNEVRARVNLPVLTASETADKAAFNSAILRERLHEFMAEGLARQDKIRHGVFVSDSQRDYPNSQSDWYKTRLPIPAKYILESEGVVKQNPGYTDQP